MSIRPVKRIVRARPTLEGAGVHLHRGFGFGDTKETDPFLLFDDFRNERPTGDWLRTLTNLSPENYLKVLAGTACAVGNSSSFVRDAGYFGTPIALVGNRQRFRECDVHVAPVEPSAAAVEAVIARQLAHGRYAPSTLYGDGHVSERFAEALEKLRPYVQKHLSYALEPVQA